MQVVLILLVYDGDNAVCEVDRIRQQASRFSWRYKVDVCV